MTESQKQFIEWLNAKDPMILRLAKKRYDIKLQRAGVNGLAGLGEDAPAKKPSFWETLAETAKSVLPSLVTMPLQKKILDIQIKRADQGLPPLDAAQYVAPIKIQADVSPETEKALTRVAQESTKTGVSEIAKRVAPYAIPAVIAWAVFRSKKK